MSLLFFMMNISIFCIYYEQIILLANNSKMQNFTFFLQSEKEEWFPIIFVRWIQICKGKYFIIYIKFMKKCNWNDAFLTIFDSLCF